MAASRTIALLVAAAKRFGVPPALLLGQAWTESKMNQGARGGAGEIGVMQIIPKWHERQARSLGFNIYTEEGNIAYGAWLLASNIKAEGSIVGGLRRYNGGPGYSRNTAVASKTQRYADTVLANARNYGDAGAAAGKGATSTGGVGAFPVPGGKIISHFGDPRDGGARSHQGIDIAAPMGAPVVAFVAGTVTRVYTGKRSGVSVQIKGADGRLYNYFHLQRATVEPGQKVGMGAALGTNGDTGNAKGTPPHLHFEIRDANNKPMDPLPIVQGAAQGLPVTQHGVAHPGQPSEPVDVQEMIASLEDAEESLTQSLAQHFEVDPESLRPNVQGLSQAIIDMIEQRSGQAVMRQELSEQVRDQEFAADPDLVGSLRTAASILGDSDVEP